MIKLFKYLNYLVIVEPEALLLLPFKKIWDRDKSKDKRIAMLELGFIYFMCDPRSDYLYIVDPSLRQKEIIEAEGIPKTWKPDESVKSAMKYYESFKPISAGLLEDTQFAIDKLRLMLRNMDLNERDDKGKLVYTLSSITLTIKQIPNLVQELHTAEKALNKDIEEQGRARGGNNKSLFEDGITL